VLQGVRGPADVDQEWHTTLDTHPLSGSGRRRSFERLGQLRSTPTGTSPTRRADRVPSRRGEETESVSYRELHRRVNEFAALLLTSLASRSATGSPSTCRGSGPAVLCRLPRLGVIHSECSAASARGCGATDRRFRRAGSRDDDAYHRNGELIAPQVRTRRSPRAAGGLEIDKVLVWGGTRANTLPRARGSRAATSYIDELMPNTAASWSSPSQCRPMCRCFLMYTMARPGQTEGRPALDGGIWAYVVALQTTRTSTPTTPTGASRISAGSPSLLHRLTGRSRSARRASCTRVCRPTGSGPAVAYRGEAGSEHLPHRADDDPVLRKLGPDEPAKYDYHFKHMRRSASRSSRTFCAGTRGGG